MNATILTTIQAVIFDLDGCLVDSEPLTLGAIANEMRAIGIHDATEREIGDRFLGVAMPVITHYVAGRLADIDTAAQIPVDFANRVETNLLARFDTDLRLIPGAIRLLDRLTDAGLGRAIATGGSLCRMRRTLGVAGLESFFTNTQCSAQEVTNGKPAPDLFELALTRLNRDPGDCIVVEDSPHGIAGASRAGIAAIGFVGGSHLDGQRSAHADLLRDAGAIAVFDGLPDLGDFILTRHGRD